MLGFVGVSGAGAVTVIFVVGHLMGFAEITEQIAGWAFAIPTVFFTVIGAATASGLSFQDRPRSMLTGPALGLVRVLAGVIPLTLGGFFGALMANDLGTLDPKKFTSYVLYVTALLGCWAVLIAIIPTTAMIGFRLYGLSRKRRRNGLRRAVTRLLSRERAASMGNWIDHFAAPVYSLCFAVSGFMAAMTLTPLIGALSVEVAKLLEL